MQSKRFRLNLVEYKGKLMSPDAAKKWADHDKDYEKWINDHKARGTWGLVSDNIAFVQEYGYMPPLECMKSK